MKKTFQGRPVVPGAVTAPAVVSHGRGFSLVYSFCISAISGLPTQGA